VAVVGAGPAGFYTAELLLRSRVVVQTDLFEALPSPYGLVRYGVAPDHPKMRSVIERFDRTAEADRFGYFGNVKVGADAELALLREFYDAVVFTTGAQEPRRLGIPGEDLPGSFTARDIINWYNCYPDHPEPGLNLDCETAVVIGNGNVALDIARILSHTPDELATTDIAAHAQAQLARSKVRRVHVIGRRGLAQASFTHPEIAELDKLSECDVLVDPSALALDAADSAELNDGDHMQARRFVPHFQRFAQNTDPRRPRRLQFEFRLSPVSIEGDGRVERIVLQRNRLEGPPGSRRAVPTAVTQTISCGLVFSCVGYRGEPIDGVPFDSQHGVIPNAAGRVLLNGAPAPGMYTSGWIKRGPSGVIGTNKVDSKETVDMLLQDVPVLQPCARRDSNELRRLLRDRGSRPIDFSQWRRIAAVEAQRGAAACKPLERITSVAEMLALLE
jgi:ferredoxin--NADP+ reductase